MKGFLVPILGAAIIATGVAGAVFVGGDEGGGGTPPPPVPGLANFWVDSNGGVCGRNATVQAYNDTTACASINAALVTAQPGDMVRLVCGTYSGVTAQTAVLHRAWMDTASQSVTISSADDTRTCATVLGTSNIAGCLSFGVAGGSGGVKWLTVQHLTFKSGNDGCITTQQGGDHLTFDDNLVSYMIVQSSNNVTVKSNTIGPCAADNNHTCTLNINEPSAGLDPQNVLVQDNIFINHSTSNANHVECMFVKAAIGLIIRRNSFSGCDATGDIFFKNQVGTTPASDVTIENNFFDQSASECLEVGYTLSVQLTNWTIRNNTFYGGNSTGCPMNLEANCPVGPCTQNTYSNVIVAGNVGSYPSMYSARSGLTWAYNRWRSSPGPGSVLGTDVTNDNFSNEVVAPGTGYHADLTLSGFDFHLKLGAPAIGFQASNCPTDDFDGQARTTPCDAGADKFG